MDRVNLLPRLKAIGITNLIETAPNGIPEIERIRQVIERNSPFVWYAASGGSVSNELGKQIVTGLLRIAKNYGFPRESGQSAKSGFDTEAAIWLASITDLKSGEALRDDIWAFMTTLLLPSVVAWRFSQPGYERFAGGIRNTFQRLWIRGIALDLGEENSDRWKLVRELSEDAMVQLFERRGIASDARLVRAIADAWTKTSRAIGRGRMEDVMRKATIYIRMRNQIVDLAFLDDDELESIVLSAFARAAGISTVEVERLAS